MSTQNGNDSPPHKKPTLLHAKLEPKEEHASLRRSRSLPKKKKRKRRNTKKRKTKKRKTKKKGPKRWSSSLDKLYIRRNHEPVVLHNLEPDWTKWIKRVKVALQNTDPEADTGPLSFLFSKKHDPEHRKFVKFERALEEGDSTKHPRTGLLDYSHNHLVRRSGMLTKQGEVSEDLKWLREMAATRFYVLCWTMTMFDKKKTTRPHHVTRAMELMKAASVGGNGSVLLKDRISPKNKFGPLLSDGKKELSDDEKTAEDLTE